MASQIHMCVYIFLHTHTHTHRIFKPDQKNTTLCRRLSPPTIQTLSNPESRQQPSESQSLLHIKGTWRAFKTHWRQGPTDPWNQRLQGWSPGGWSAQAAGLRAADISPLPLSGLTGVGRAQPPACVHKITHSAASINFQTCTSFGLSDQYLA